MRWRKQRSWSLGRRGNGNRRLRRLHRFLPSIVAIFSIATAAGASSGAGPQPARLPLPLVIVALPQTSCGQLHSSEMRNCRKIAEGPVAVGLMPVASPSDTDPNRTWVTLGAGRAAVAGEIAGKALPGGGFQIDIEPIKEANRRAHTGAAPGLLGSRLHDRGLTTALIAHEDTGRQVPPSAAIVMDETGRIDGGGILESRASRRRQLDPEQVRSAVGRELGDNAVVLLDLTGTASLGEVDVAVGQASAAVQARRGTLCLLTGLSPADRRTMGLMALQPSPGRQQGMLTSQSTRWPGVVVPADFAPSLEANPDSPAPNAPLMAGRMLEGVAAADGVQRVDRLDRMLTDQFALEGTAARLYASYMMLLAAATFAIGARGRREGQAEACGTRQVATGMPILRLPALVGVALPIGLLVCPLAGIGQARQMVAACVVSLALGFLAVWPGRAMQPLRAVLLIGSTITLADPLLGSPLMRLGPLGFGVVTGSRFYGIGNEYVGVLCAMAPILLGLVRERDPRAGWAVAPVAALIVLIVGAPWWGANWGGCVAMAAAFASMWAFLGQRNGWLRAAVAVVLVLAAATLPAALDLLRPAEEQSHIGVAAAALLNDHFGTVRDTAIRKLAMNWRLAQLGSWWWTLAPVGLLGIWQLLCRSREIWRHAQVAAPVRAAFLGVFVGAVVGLLVNDSGVVMFGMTLAGAFSAFVFVVARTESAWS